jgi:hypothetical protein
MRTYAAIVPAASLGTRVVAWTTGERYVDQEGRWIGPILAGGWVLRIICGSAIRHVAEANAAEVAGGRVIDIDSKYWPGQAQVEDTIISLGIAPVLSAIEPSANVEQTSTQAA